MCNGLKMLWRLLPDVLSSEEMAAIEENADALGFSRRLMMENAGAAFARFVASKVPVCDRVFLVLCGTGNNGGDGFVAARHLRNIGARIHVVLIGRQQDIRSEEARSNWLLLLQMDDLEKTLITDSSEISIVKKILEKCDYVIDAILGTGFRGVLKEPVASVVKEVNSCGKTVFAVDVPTGLGPSMVEGSPVIKATYTLTFHKKKDFLENSPYVGGLEVADIGIPIEAELYTGPGDVRRVVKTRRRFSHKGDYGYVLVIGGSEIFSGAPALAALSALRIGVGLSIVAAPESVASSIRSFLPDLVVYATPGSHLNVKALPLVSSLMDRVESLVIGPGLGLHEETVEVVHIILEEARKRSLPTLVDADGFKALKGSLDLLRGTIATPHPGEFKHVFGEEAEERWFSNVEMLTRISRKYGFTILLKGAETIITDGAKLKVNKHATPGLAVGGTGDVLSGIIAAFLAWGNDKLSSAAAAAYLHGEAGIMAVGEKGFHITASDLVEKIPEAMRRFDREEH
ncbi:MAG: NAD(P)H-hydrate dehydratase [Thermoproteota archaeon]